MEPKRIVINDITECHPNQKSYKTDLYYQRLANRLQDRFFSIGIIKDERTRTVMHLFAIMLAKYMEDIVADSGQWRTFSNLCQKLYGHPVPLYHEDEDYYPDEPSLNAIRFLLWTVASNVTDDIVLADAKRLKLIAETAYEILYEAFEEAPVNEQLAEDIEAQLHLATEGFNQLRTVLTWIFFSCYLTSDKQNENLFNKHLEEMMNMADDENFPKFTPSMAIYYAKTRCLFPYEIGPLALYPKDYLAAMMKTKGMEAEAEEVAKIEMMGTATYKYEFIQPDHLNHDLKQERLRLTRTNGQQIDIDSSELNLKQKMLREHDGCLATSFVFYQNEWHLNGMLMPLKDINKHWNKMCEDDKENLKPGTVTLTAEMMLERTKGQQIAYFADGEQLKDFMEKKIHFPRQMMSFIDERGGELPSIFIDKEEKMNCLQFFFDYSTYIADPANPFYDKDKACEKAFNILWDADAISTHAVNYLLDHGFLPDIFDDEVLSIHSTHEEKRHDIDFLMRFYRREKY